MGERLVATQLAQAKVNLERTEIKAPISGVIVSEMVETASYIQKGATLCVIHDTQRVEVSCDLRADQLMHVLDQRLDTFAGWSSDKSSGDYELPPTPVTVTYRVVGRDDTVMQWQGILSRYEGIGLNAQSRTIPIRITVENPRQMTRNGRAVDETDTGSPPALVQGMFVECSIHTVPKRPLVLVPKLALRPGSQVWRFTPDPSILYESIPGQTDQVQPISPKPSAQRTSSPNEAVKEDAVPGENRKSKATMNVEDWLVGRIEIVSNVNAIRLVSKPDSTGDEYWICEATEELSPGTMAVISPIANMIGGGKDKARLPIASDTPKS